MLLPGRPPPNSGSASGWSFTVQPRGRSGPSRVKARGELDVAALPELRGALARAAGGASRPAQVVLDLSDVTFLDAAVLGALVAERRVLQAAGGSLRLTGVSPKLQRLIGLTGLRETLGLD
jgi:anti-sigma B factor antagonist